MAFKFGRLALGRFGKLALRFGRLALRFGTFKLALIPGILALVAGILALTPGIPVLIPCNVGLITVPGAATGDNSLLALMLLRISLLGSFSQIG